MLTHSLSLVFLVWMTRSPVSEAAPVVSTTWANIAGVDLLSQSGRPYSGYLGIPYALPPTGERRFAKPQPPPSPNGNFFNASAAPAVCTQPSQSLQVGRGMSEDCLYLNVFVPSVVSSGSLPVMVWIHGGAFQYRGANDFTPSKLVADDNVIVVVVQFRLGVFGFLSSASSALPGNLALMDQVFALQWVQNHIRAFGGDPDQVTLAGQSSGGISVSLHVLSPYSKGLFRRAMIQSAGPTVPLAINEDPRPFFLNMSREVGCYTEQSFFSRWMVQDDDSIIRCLKSKSTEELLKAGITSLPSGTSNFFWVPVVDKHFVPRDPRVLMSDREYLLSQGLADMDFLFGVNNNEGGMLLNVLAASPGVDVSNANQDAFFGILLDTALRNRIGNTQDLVVREMVNYTYTYPRDKATGQRALANAVNLYGDYSFVIPVLEFARAVSSIPTARGKRYLFLFDVDVEANRNTPAPGSRHADELAYLFDSSTLPVADNLLSSQFVNIVSAFVKTGNPGSPVRGALGGADWPPYTLQDQAYLVFSQTPSLSNRLFDRRAALWLDVIPRVSAYRLRERQELTAMASPVSYFTGWFNVKICPLHN